MDELTLPYLIGQQGSNASYAFYPSGAIRRIVAIVELGRLKDELGVRVLELSGDESATCAAVSQRLFGV